MTRHPRPTKPDMDPFQGPKDPRVGPPDHGQPEILHPGVPPPGHNRHHCRTDTTAPVLLTRLADRRPVIPIPAQQTSFLESGLPLHY